MDGLDRCSLIDRYARTRAGTRDTPDKKASVQSVQERVESAAKAAMSDAVSCPWCGRPFHPRQSGGRPQRFCRLTCRRALHAAARTRALDDPRGMLRLTQPPTRPSYCWTHSARSSAIFSVRSHPKS